MNVIGLDPGPVQSAYVEYQAETQSILNKAIVPNEQLLDYLKARTSGFLKDPEEANAVLVIEQVAAMGMAVGAEVFETVFWSGRFAQSWGREFHRIKRHEIKMHLCGNMRAKDGNIRQSLIDKLGAPGRAKAKGPTYGIAGDMWQALAVAVVWSEKRGEQKVRELFHAA